MIGQRQWYPHDSLPVALWTFHTRGLLVRPVVGLKNTVLSLVPVVLVSQPWLEVLAVVFTRLASLVLQCWFKPWRTLAANLVDAAVTFLLPLLRCGRWPGVA